jgi:hypothetical protein
MQNAGHQRLIERARTITITDGPARTGPFVVVRRRGLNVFRDAALAVF